MINYNSITEEMIFEANGTKLALVNAEYVDTIYITRRIYEMKLPEGYTIQP
jgi:hypothetical protein